MPHPDTGLAPAHFVATSLEASLPPDVRDALEDELGTDISDVQAHTEEEAKKAADALDDLDGF